MNQAMKVVLAISIGGILFAGCSSRESEVRKLLTDAGIEKDQIEEAVTNFKMRTPAEQKQIIAMMKASRDLMALGTALDKEGQTSQSASRKASQCAENLRLLQTAVEQAQFGEKYDGTTNSIIGDDKYIRKMPKCPDGGTYSLPAKGENDGKVTCSIGGAHCLRD